MLMKRVLHSNGSIAIMLLVMWWSFYLSMCLCHMRCYEEWAGFLEICTFSKQLPILLMELLVMPDLDLSFGPARCYMSELLGPFEQSCLRCQLPWLCFMWLPWLMYMQEWFVLSLAIVLSQRFFWISYKVIRGCYILNLCKITDSVKVLSMWYLWHIQFAGCCDSSFMAGHWRGAIFSFSQNFYLFEDFEFWYIHLRRFELLHDTFKYAGLQSVFVGPTQGDRKFKRGLLKYTTGTKSVFSVFKPALALFPFQCCCLLWFPPLYDVSLCSRAFPLWFFVYYMEVLTPDDLCIWAHGCFDWD